MIRNPHIQVESAEVIAQLQQERLREEIAYIATGSPFYKRLFAEHNIDPTQIRALKDLEQLPVTTKEDLQRFNNDFVAVPKGEIIDYVTTSGTLGEPVTFALTDSDLDRLAYNEAQSFTTAGCTKDDVLQLMTTIDKRFMAVLAYFLGVL